MNMAKGKNYLIFIVLLAVECILSLALAAMQINKTNGKDSFMQEGYIYDIPQQKYKSFVLPEGECDADGVWSIKTNDFPKWIGLSKIKKQRLYLYINLSDISSKELEAYVFLYTPKSTKFSKLVTLKEGDNYIELEKVSFSGLGLRFYNQENVTFRVNDMELRAKKKMSDFAPRLLKKSMILLFLFMGITGIFFRPICKVFYKLDSYEPLNILQTVYIRVGNTIYMCTKVINKNVKSVLRFIIFFLLMVYYNLAYNKILIPYSLKEKYIVSILGILLLAILSLDQKLEKKKWNKKIVYFWFILCLMMCISDLFVKKEFMYEGLILLFVFGFASYVIYNNKQNRQIFLEFYRSVHLYFVGSTIFCLFFRSDSNPRYLGTFTYSTAFSRYESLIAVVAVVCLLKCINKTQKMRYSIFYVIELITSLFFVWKTQTRTALAAVLFIIIVVGPMQIVICKREHVRKNAIIIAVLGILLTPILFIGLEIGIHTLPERFKTDIKFKNDAVEIMTNKKVVYAAQAGEEENRIFYSFSGSSLEGITSGRTIFWKAYLREMNWLGHEKYANVLGKRQNSHCALLQIPYQFGVLTVIPYFFFIFFILMNAIRNMFTYISNKREESILVFGIVIIFIMNAMFQVIEILFSGFIWVVFYLFSGTLFIEEDE
ncbi:MAG: hypothetical protein K2L07_06980 [Lachnospiraceae bacterium]|nr:hypothetical protein [Lachnospiraceae bacterium]